MITITSFDPFTVECEAQTFTGDVTIHLPPLRVSVPLLPLFGFPDLGGASSGGL